MVSMKQDILGYDFFMLCDYNVKLNQFYNLQSTFNIMKMSLAVLPVAVWVIDCFK